MSFGKNKNKSNNSYNGTDNYSGTTNFNQTSTPNNPAWVDATAQTLNGSLNGLTGRDPTSFVAGPNALQTQAGGQASQLTGNPGALGAALGETGYVMNANAPQVGSAATASPYVQTYMDPYLNDVVGAASADLTHNEGQTRAADDLALAQSGAFGGSGAALTKAADTEALARTRASTLSGLRSQGYTQALGAAQQDAQRSQSTKELNAQLRGQQMDRALTGAQQLAGLTNSADANTRANVATQAGVGQSLQQIDQAKAQAPLDYQAMLTQMFSGLPLNLFQGQTQTGTQDESGTESQSGTSTGNSTGMNFGFKLGGKG